MCIFFFGISVPNESSTMFVAAVVVVYVICVDPFIYPTICQPTSLHIIVTEKLKSESKKVSYEYEKHAEKSHSTYM